MNSLTLVISFLLGSYVIAFLFAIILGKTKINLSSFVSSFLFLLVAVCLPTFFGISYAFSFVLVAFLITCALRSALKEKLIKGDLWRNLVPSREISAFFLVLIFFLLLFGQPSNFQQRSYINPDPFGYASVSGSVARYGDFQDVLNQYDDWVGVPFKWDANWDNPAEFKLLESPWKIPDATLKYGIANGYYLHNGFSFLIGKLVDLRGTREIETFLVLWNFFTVFSAALLVVLIAHLVTQAVWSSRESKLLLSKSNVRGKFTLLTLTLLALMLNSKWLSVFIIEGFGNQLLSYSICLFSVVLTLDSLQSKNNGIAKVASIQLLALTAQFLVYAQQIVFQIFALLVIYLSLLIAKTFSSGEKKSYVIFRLTTSVLGALILFVASLRIPIVDTAVRALTSSGGGGATHLGSFSPFRSIGVSALNLGELKPPRDNSGNNQFTELFWPNSGPDNSGYLLRGQGYEMELTSTDTIYFQLALLFLIVLIVSLALGGRKKISGIVFFLQIAPLLLVSGFYLFTRTGNYLVDNPNNAFNDYIWMRILAYNAILLWVSLGIGLLLAFEKLPIENRGKTKVSDKFFRKHFIKFFAVLILLSLSAVENIAFSRKVAELSDSALVTPNCWPHFQKGRTVYLSSDTIVPELIVSLCGSDLRLLNDSFSVVHRADNKQHYVIRLERSEGKSWDLRILGTFKHDKDIVTPCDLECSENLVEAGR